MKVRHYGDPEAPALINDYVFNPEALHLALIAIGQQPVAQNCWFAGPRSTGKTTFADQLAARLGRRLFRINFDESSERAEFVGGNTIENGTVVWKGGALVKAITHPGALVLLDEIGFARPQALAVLHAVCEAVPNRGLVIPETGQRIAVAPGVAFFAADNTNGHGDPTGHYAGVREQNSALIDRFGYTVWFDFLPEEKETELVAGRCGLPIDAARMLVKFCAVAREKARAGVLSEPPSLRQLFAWAAAVSQGMPIGVAYKGAIVNKFSPEAAVELQGIYVATIDESKFNTALGG
jgi:cobaltochelatase CobS